MLNKLWVEGREGGKEGRSEGHEREVEGHLVAFSSFLKVGFCSGTYYQKKTSNLVPESVALAFGKRAGESGGGVSRLGLHTDKYTDIIYKCLVVTSAMKKNKAKYAGEEAREQACELAHAASGVPRSSGATSWWT